MSEFKFTIQFSGSETSQFRKNAGLRLDQISKIFDALYQVLGVDATNKLTLKEKKTDNQAFVLATPEKITYEKLKLVHQNIANINVDTLSAKELNYAKTLMDIKNQDDIELEVYTDDESFYFKYSDFKIPEKKIRHYYDVRVIYGKIAQLGNTRVDQMPYVWIDVGTKNSIKVRLSAKQDGALRNFYREKKLKFKVRYKKKIQDRTIMGSADLIDFEALEAVSFTTRLVEEHS